MELAQVTTCLCASATDGKCICHTGNSIVTQHEAETCIVIEATMCAHKTAFDAMHMYRCQLESRHKQVLTRPVKAWNARIGVQLGFSAECKVLASTGTTLPAVKFRHPALLI